MNTYERIRVYLDKSRGKTAAGKPALSAPQRRRLRKKARGDVMAFEGGKSTEVPGAVVFHWAGM